MTHFGRYAIIAMGMTALAGCETMAPVGVAPERAAVVEVPPPAVSVETPAVDVTAPGPVVVIPETPKLAPELVQHYAARDDGARTVAAIDAERLATDMLRTRVSFGTDEAPGTVVIDTASYHLYLVEPDGMATRYGVAIGREGFGWTGEGRIARTARWPRWTPPSEMIARAPELEQWRGGMPGGNDNPLGARALYINFGEADSGYRIHGTNEPRSIGRAASSGCFRMLNQDAIDLHARIATGAKVVVR